MKDIVDFEPDIILISTAPSYLFWRCPPLNVDLVGSYCKAIKKQVKSSRIVVVGPHASEEPDWVLEKTTADFAFIGEPDGNLSTSWSIKDYEDCEWLHQKGATGTKASPQRLFKDGRTVNYQIFSNLQSYQPHAWGQSVQVGIGEHAGGGASVVEYARGCSYDCAFCLRSGFRKNLRFKPIHTFEKEIIQLASKGINYVFFIDEDFGRPISKYVQAMEVLSQNGMKFGCQARPDAFGPEEIELLSSYGCLYLELGLESLDATTRTQMGKFEEQFDVAQIVELAKLKIPYVFANVFDVGRLIGSDFKVEQNFDNEGYIPNPFICYPGTSAGNRVIKKFRDRGVAGSSWDICEAVYEFDSIVAGTRKLDKPPRLEDLENEVAFVRALLDAREHQEADTGAKTRFEEVINPER